MFTPQVGIVAVGTMLLLLLCLGRLGECGRQNGNWGVWSGYSTCTTTCGNGRQNRWRGCDRPAPANGGQDCPGSWQEYQSCIVRYCPVNGNWGQWGRHGTCSKTCGSGTQGERRSCTNPTPAYGGQGCPGARSQTQYCNVRTCPVNGNWGQWSSYRTCSKTCGSGTQRRSRSCTNPPPSNDGHSCPGASSQTRSCNVRMCPVNGNWAQWSSYSTCSKTCGRGTRENRRSCTNPEPAYDGLGCVGSSNQTVYCHVKKCLVTTLAPPPTTTEATTQAPTTVKGCYSHKSPGCVTGQDIGRYPLSLDQCKSMCLGDAKCLSFEYGVAHGGRNTRNIGECVLNGGADATGCNGTNLNLDLYIKMECKETATTQAPTTAKAFTHAPTTTKECKDNAGGCLRFKEYCNKDSYIGRLVRKGCQKTCGCQYNSQPGSGSGSGSGDRDDNLVENDEKIEDKIEELLESVGDAKSLEAAEKLTEGMDEAGSDNRVENNEKIEDKIRESLESIDDENIPEATEKLTEGMGGPGIDNRVENDENTQESDFARRLRAIEDELQGEMW